MSNYEVFVKTPEFDVLCTSANGKYLVCLKTI
jgi:hypothetical protein